LSRLKKEAFFVIVHLPSCFFSARRKRAVYALINEHFQRRRGKTGGVGEQLRYETLKHCLANPHIKTINIEA
jgi:hypothetical protein